MKKIILTCAEKRILRERYGLAQSTINYSLNGVRDSSLVRLVREKAIEIVNKRINCI